MKVSANWRTIRSFGGVEENRTFVADDRWAPRVEIQSSRAGAKFIARRGTERGVKLTAQVREASSLSTSTFLDPMLVAEEEAIDCGFAATGRQQTSISSTRQTAKCATSVTNSASATGNCNQLKVAANKAREEEEAPSATTLQQHQPPTMSKLTSTTLNLAASTSERRLPAPASKVMIPLILVLLVCASPAPISAQQANSSSGGGIQNWTTERNGDQPFGELLAIGAISPSLDANGNNRPGRLVDRIEINLAQNESQVNKLQYIIEFMRQNKLTKFCDLLTSERPEIKRLNEKLNSLDQFTLFVPTDEALLLMPSIQMEQIRGSAPETKQFLLAHATSDLVTPSSVGANTNQLLFSLSGIPMRVTATRSSATPARSNQTGDVLIVNGASTLAGQSYALQEQSNTSATYAIVHLIDRSLYPATSNQRLLDLLHSVAPSMAKYLEKDPTFLDELAPTGSKRLTTVLAPNEAAFKQVLGSKLGARLDTNQTFLREFLRGHLTEGLHFTGQLDSPPSKLRSLSGTELEFEPRKLQSRIVLLVNSIPIVEPDLVASNGVIHLLAQPLVGRHLLDDCQCGQAKQQQLATTTQSPSETVAAAYDRLWSSASGGPNKPIKWNGDSNELEREESRLETPPPPPGISMSSNSQRTRAQRSGLVARNNRDFYRPSAAPANLLASQPQPLESSAPKEPANLKLPPKVTVEQAIKSEPTVNFDVDRAYKIVLDANTRQKMRENIRTLGNSQQPQTSLFTYDKPLLSNSELQNNTRAANLSQQRQTQRPYSELINATGVPPTNRGWTNIEQLSQAATSRQQRLLKFQVEDARPPNTNLNDTAYQISAPAIQPLVKSPENQVAAKLFAEQQNAAATKTSIAPPGFMGCAFYDAECKRLVGRLVRLPVIRNRQQQKNPQPDQGKFPMTSRPDQHLDSTFGETTDSPLRQLTTTRMPASFARQDPSNRQQFGRLTSTVSRVSPLNQPLPPWNDEAAQLANWRAQDRDIARITNNGQQDLAPGFTGGIGRQQIANKSNTIFLQQQQQPQQFTRQPPEQIFLTPVKVIQLQEAKLPANLTNGAMFVAPSPIMRQQPASSLPARVSFTGSRTQQFHTPTPYSVSLVTTHTPPMFSSQQQQNSADRFGRLTNFTAPEQVSFSEIKQQPVALLNNLPLKSPAALRKERPGANAVKLQEELSRIHQQQQVIYTPVQMNEDFTGDFSITSARLTSTNNNSSQLQSQASNQAPNVSANFARSVPSLVNQVQQPILPEQLNDQNVEYFQDRSIADIMDDSGLRIDGQQVTFSRLKECLVEAGLLSLTTQSGSSSLTIFMPTDAAFQRLVQQQAAMQQLLSPQQQTSRGRSSFQSSRLTKFNDGRIPLAIRAPSSSRLTAPPTSDASSQDASINAAVDRLTLDCRTEQVRQLLLDHLSARMVTPKQLQSDLAISSLGGRQLLLSSVPSKKIVIVDGQPVIAATRAKNGMVYVVNKFLNLTQQVPNVVDLMTTQPNLTTFLSYMSFSKLTDRVKRESGPITILAPTNEAFEQLSTNARQLINSDPAALADVLRGHIVEGAQFGKLISMRNQLKTMNPDQTIEAKVIKPNVYLLDNQMTSMRLVGTAGNGVVNTIDRLIVPAWLRNSMSANGRTTPGTSAESTANQPSVFTGELDQSLPATATTTTNGQKQRATMNLPLLNGRPTQFEQRLPGTRASSNSFLLAGANDQLPRQINQQRERSPEISGNNFNNNEPLNDFVELQPTADTNNNNGNSPFLRVASNLTAGLVPKQRRTGNEPPAATTTTMLRQQPQQQQQHQNPPVVSNGTSTRNMQLIEKLANLMQAHKFVRFLAGSKLPQLLKPDMNYVILVPSDEAIEKLPMQILDMLEREPERLADLAHYHVLETTFEFINNIPDGQTLNSINEKDVIFNWHRNNTVLTASGAIIKGGIQEENIAVLLVDRVLYPTPGDILNIVTKSPILSNFTSLLQSTGLQSQLSLAGPFTLFAPSDFAFMRMDKRDLEFMQRNRETARRFLLRHMSQPVVFTSAIELSNSTSRPLNDRQSNFLAVKLQQAVPTLAISNMLGEDLSLRKVDDFFSVNDINISYADVAATNGIVHVIDGIL